MNKLWLIINMTGSTWAKNEEDHLIPPSKRPSYVHTDKERAEEELLRLQSKYSENTFVLFEAVATAVEVTPFIIATPSYFRVDYIDPKPQVPMPKGWAKKKAAK